LLVGWFVGYLLSKSFGYLVSNLVSQLGG